MPQQARIDQVKDALAALINSVWTDRDSADDEVITKSRVDIDSTTNIGRKVYIFPTAYSGTPATREEDQDDYTLMVWIVERYQDQGDPPEDWVTERKYFTEWLLKKIGNARTVRLLPVEGESQSGAWPQEADVTTVLDYDRLATGKQFVSVIMITYREQRDPEEGEE